MNKKIKPRNRKEIFLNALADGKAPDVEPRTREEIFLAEQAKREGRGTSWNDLTDRPFGKFLVDGDDVSFLWMPAYNLCLGDPQQLIDGKTYRIDVVPSVSNPTRNDIGYFVWDKSSLTFTHENGGKIIFTQTTLEDGQVIYKIDAFKFNGLSEKDGFSLLAFHQVEEIKELDPEYFPEGYPYEETEEISVTWNGDPTGLLGVESTNSMLSPLYKVSEATVPLETFLDNKLVVVSRTIQNPNADVVNVYEDLRNSEGLLIDEQNRGFSDGSNFAVIYEGNVTLDSYTFPEPGIYFSRGSGGGLTVHTYKLSSVKTILETLDPKYLPEALQFGEEEGEVLTLYNDDELWVGRDATVNNKNVYVYDLGVVGSDISWKEGLPKYGTICLTVDGDIYSGAVKIGYEDENEYWLYAGNLALLSNGKEDTGESFFVMLSGAHPGGSLDISVRTTNVYSSSGVVIKVEQETSTITPIDEKYLPKAEAVTDVTEAPTAENFNALLASLRAAGYLNS